MSKLNSKKSRILGFAVLSAFVVLLSACGKKNQILPPVVPPTTNNNTNTGGGFVGGSCGGVGGTPIPVIRSTAASPSRRTCSL
ncbi:MAG: hypothetical protein R3B54_17445 [Bdellovibrionota bacterium]